VTVHDQIGRKTVASVASGGLKPFLASPEAGKARRLLTLLDPEAILTPVAFHFLF